MQRVSKLEADSLRINGFKIVKTKHKYYLFKKQEITVNTGYAEFL